MLTFLCSLLCSYLPVDEYKTCVHIFHEQYWWNLLADDAKMVNWSKIMRDTFHSLIINVDGKYTLNSPFRQLKNVFGISKYLTLAFFSIYFVVCIEKSSKYFIRRKIKLRIYFSWLAGYALLCLDLIQRMTSARSKWIQLNVHWNTFGIIVCTKRRVKKTQSYEYTNISAHGIVAWNKSNLHLKTKAFQIYSLEI